MWSKTLISRIKIPPVSSIRNGNLNYSVFFSRTHSRIVFKQAEKTKYFIFHYWKTILYNCKKLIWMLHEKSTLTHKIKEEQTHKIHSIPSYNSNQTKILSHINTPLKLFPQLISKLNFHMFWKAAELCGYSRNGRNDF